MEICNEHGCVYETRSCPVCELEELLEKANEEIKRLAQENSKLIETQVELENKIDYLASLGENLKLEKE